MPARASKKYADGARPAVARGIPVKLVDALIDSIGLDEEQITKDSTLVEDLGMDSLDIVELAMTLEDGGEEISDAVLDHWRTVGDVMKTLEARA